MLDVEEEVALIEEGCQVVHGRRPVNWKEEVQVLIYWATQICPIDQIMALISLTKRAGFKHLTPNLIRNVSTLVIHDELRKCMEDERCEMARERLDKLRSFSVPSSSLN
jgi:hypothetical protein